MAVDAATQATLGTMQQMMENQNALTLMGMKVQDNNQKNNALQKASEGETNTSNQAARAASDSARA